MPKITLFTSILILFLALFSDIVANMRPLWCQINGENYFPAFRSITNRGRIDYGDPNLKPYEENQSWASIPESNRAMPLIKYSCNIKTADKTFRPLAAGTSGGRHWLGTDKEGRDIFAALIGGARTAVLTGALAICISLLIGGILGGIAGYFGDNSVRVSLVVLPAVFLASLPAFYLTLLSRNSIFNTNGISAFSAIAIWFFLGAAGFGAGHLLSKIPMLSKKITLPLDLIILRFSEIFSAVPGIIILLAATVMLKDRSLTNIIILIGVLSWPGSARILRSELLKIRQLEYITAARGLDIPEWRILVRHALPNAIRPLLTVFALGASSAVLLETSLGFLGIASYDINQITWGQLLQTARKDVTLWWIWFPPGVIICLLVAAMFEWSEYLNR